MLCNCDSSDRDILCCAPVVVVSVTLTGILYCATPLMSVIVVTDTLYCTTNSSEIC